MDNIITCLYYSTVTITTLGYGDISSLTITAQILVMSETILGVITIGLFLNSLSIQQANELTEQEKEKEKQERFKTECEKILRHSKIIEQNLQFYLTYTYDITTPVANRNNENVINEDFSFNDMKDLFLSSFRMTDDFNEPAVSYYFKHLKSLENSIKELILDINFSYWPNLEIECIKFLENCRKYDFSSSILSQPKVNVGDQKGSVYGSKMIENHSGEVEFRRSNMINQYIALYKLIKVNFKFIKIFQSQIEEIKLLPILKK